jgi:hypothetical protein
MVVVMARPRKLAPDFVDFVRQYRASGLVQSPTSHAFRDLVLVDYYT